ncbi:hypothetical protein [Belnapia sp. F-4-1]|uniref:hypothetical protein n=1 Tax=Belnapia sp. F-4-1 TaxID=1545443 RepID=UPI000A7499DA|nr:hypothetical protein [Belnapia sp. F-4-1]
MSAATTQPAAGGGTQDSVELSAQARLLLGLIQAMNGGQARPSAPQVYGPPGIRLTAPGSGTLGGAGSIAAVSGGSQPPAVAGVQVDPASTGNATSTVSITPAGGAVAQVAAPAGDNLISAHALVADRAQSAALQVTTGSGKDLIAADTTGRLSLDAGAGDDQVSARFGDFSDIDLGDGDNMAIITGHYGTVRSGKGNDVISVQGMGTTVSAGAGDDTVSGAQWVNAGTGQDSVHLGNAELSTLVYRPGDGLDEVVLPPIESGVQQGGSRPVIGDGTGSVEAQAIGIDDWGGFRMGLPSAGEPGHGSAHAALVLQGFGTQDVTARLDGTDLTLTLPGGRDAITIRNYTPGRVSFIFDDRAYGGELTGTRTLPGIS